MKAYPGVPMHKLRFIPVPVIMACMLAVEQPAFANVGLPTIIFVWPISWLLLLLVVPIEARVATRILNIPFKKGLGIATRANIISTIAGIPITWLLLVVVELLVGGGHRSTSGELMSTGEQIYHALIEGPWMVADIWAPDWAIPLSIFVMNIPFFFMSVFVEKLAVARYIDNECTAELLEKWSWEANLLSYTLINGGVLILIVVGIISDIT